MNFVFELILNHREHSPGLSGHYAEGFTEMNLEISEMEALKDVEIMIHHTYSENLFSRSQNHENDTFSIG